MKKLSIFFLILIILFAKNNLYSFEKIENKTVIQDSIQKVGKVFKRLIESAHPTPDPDLFSYPLKLQVPMIQSQTFLPFFLNVNTIEKEESESYKMQNESSIAVNPTNPQNLIASAVDYRSESSTWVYVSNDGGKTWENHNLGKPYPNWQSTNDPSVYFSQDGIGYLCYGGFGKIDDKQPVMVGENGVFLAKTTDGGTTWKAHIPVIVHQGNQTLDSTFEDKYYVQVDNSPKSPFYKNLYNPWKRVTPRDSATQIVISKSTDSGESWSKPIPISPRKTGSSEDTTYGQSFPLCATGPNGEVYVVWNDGIVHGVGFSKSLDGGAIFSSPKIIKSYNIFGTTKYIESQGGYRHTVKGKVRAEAYPVIQCDITGGPRNGNIYLTWAADSIPNIYFSYSEDKGETWSTPIIVHSVTTNDQFWQWLAIDPKNGDLAIMYFDSRDDDSNILVNCYVSFSGDGGKTWIDKRVGDGENDLRLNPFLDNAFAGDYSGCAFYEGKIYPSWVDMRNAVSNIRNSDVYTAIINTRGPLPVENFKIKIIPNETTKLNLSWMNPTTLSFGQPLNANDYKIRILRENKIIATLTGGTTNFQDENLDEYKYYNYQIYIVTNNDSSIARIGIGNPGGSKNPSRPILLSADGFEEGKKFGYLLKVQMPALRADSLTPLIDLSKYSIFLDSSLVESNSVSTSDSGKTLDVKFDISNYNLNKGYYKINVNVSTSKSYSSEFSNELIAYSGFPIEINENNSFTENFDNAKINKYYMGKKWDRTDEFSFSKPYSLTESPNAKYENNKKDTFLLFPIKINQKTFLNFRNAAIVEGGDEAVIEISSDKGITWTNQFANKQAKYLKTDYNYWSDGTLDERDWVLEQLEFPGIVGDFLIRLRFNSNSFRNDVGWFIDDILISTNPLSVAESNNTSVNIYPSIASEYIKINISEPLTGNYKINMYSLFGTKMMEKEINVNEDVINISSLNQGIYFIVLEKDGNIISKNKFSVIRRN